MTNKQLAAALKVMNRYPNHTIRKDGETLVPVRNGQEGTPVEVTDAMTHSQIERLLIASCEAING